MVICGILALVVLRETEEMERSCMYMRLLNMAIELCEFLSDIKHPENHELISSTTSQLLKERRQARLEHSRHVFEENQAMHEAIQRGNRELLLAKVDSIHNQIEERNKQIADGTLAEDEIDDMSEQDSDSQITEGSSSQDESDFTSEYDSDISMITQRSSEDESEYDSDS